MANLYDYEMESITGERVPLGNYKDTVCLIVNVATE